MTLKRDDIQWLRALAIFAVLAFHIWPKQFPYGYLGVDIFFVISGYLMTSIIAKSSNQSYLQFYLRRIKRIFPTCLFVLMIFVFIGLFVLIPTHFQFLQMEALWSIFFVNNLPPMFGEHLYFELVSGYKFFLHTWSLGVEIQFYLIAPFLINFILSRSKPLVTAAIIAIFSVTFQLLSPYESVAFGLMFCRIWQFLIGTFAYLIGKNVKNGYQKLSEKEGEENFEIADDGSEKQPSSSDNLLLSYLSYVTIFTTAILILLCFIPFNIPSWPTVIPPMLRLTATILTGVFIVLNGMYPLTVPEKVSQWLVYIGDASYVIYLIHWPLIVYFRYFALIDYYGTIFTLICIFVISIPAHELFEKPLGRASLSFNLIFIAVNYIILLFMIYGLKGNLQSNPYILGNENEFQSCKPFYYEDYCKADPIIEKYLTNRPKLHDYDRYCSIKLNKTSTKTIMITGNSFVYFQIRGILDAIKQAKSQFSKAFVTSHLGCSLLAGSLNKKVTDWSCESIDGSHNELFKAIKPDLIIHTSRLDHIIYQAIPPGDINNDYYYKEIERSVLSMAKYTKKLIIIEPTPSLVQQSKNNDGKAYINPLTIAHEILMGGPLEEYNITIEEYRTQMYPAWNRVKAAVKKCSNCVLVPTEKLFCNEIACQLVDLKTKLGRYCDISHITPRESLLLIPGLVKAIDDK